MKKHFAKQIFAAALAISFVCGLSACREREEEQLSLKPVIYLYPGRRNGRLGYARVRRNAHLHLPELQNRLACFGKT
ncbi:MAG: hypothetical protein ACLRY7_05755 [Hominenteromicrobium sp.]|uniref:hypothetical protein n=1 Tax=Hominenteromicrobium sp. TaxID=3073581 RepID=UPI0039A1CE3E